MTLYRTVGWSSADKPDALHGGLLASHSLVTTWYTDRLVGLGSAISDGHLVVFFPHLVVDAEFQGQGIGCELMRRLMAKYQGFHQQILLADGRALDFLHEVGCQSCGTNGAAMDL